MNWWPVSTKSTKGKECLLGEWIILGQSSLGWVLYLYNDTPILVTINLYVMIQYMHGMLIICTLNTFIQGMDHWNLARNISFLSISFQTIQLFNKYFV